MDAFSDLQNGALNKSDFYITGSSIGIPI